MLGLVWTKFDRMEPADQLAASGLTLMPSGMHTRVRTGLIPIDGGHRRRQP